MPTPLQDPPLRTCEFDLTLDFAAPRAARSLLNLLLPQWGVRDEDVLDGATIVISELVTNALLHCDEGGPVRVRIELREELLRLYVADPSPAIPAQRVTGPDAEEGRGLSIVDQIAEEWGVEPQPDGKRVFADLPLSPARCA